MAAGRPAQWPPTYYLGSDPLLAAASMPASLPGCCPRRSVVDVRRGSIAGLGALLADQQDRQPRAGSPVALGARRSRRRDRAWIRSVTAEVFLVDEARWNGAVRLGKPLAGRAVLGGGGHRRRRTSDVTSFAGHMERAIPHGVGARAVGEPSHLLQCIAYTLSLA